MGADLISGRARELREAARLSRSELARALGTTPAWVSRWEAGLRSPRGETALKYAKLLARRALELKAIGLTKR
jgi:transcriptional regulator with XRE-family HTH domain